MPSTLDPHALASVLVFGGITLPVDRALFGHCTPVPEKPSRYLLSLSFLATVRNWWGGVGGGESEQPVQSWIPRMDFEALPTPSRVLSMNTNN